MKVIPNIEPATRYYTRLWSQVRLILWRVKKKKAIFCFDRIHLHQTKQARHTIIITKINVQFVWFPWQQKWMGWAVALMTSESRAWGVCGSAWVSLGNDRPHQFFQGTARPGDLPVCRPVMMQDRRPEGAHAAPRLRNHTRSSFSYVWCILTVPPDAGPLN